jgi:excisionase family DNA binding protein
MPKDDEASHRITPTSLPRLLSVEEVAAVLSVSQKTVRRKIDAGVLPACRVGRLLRIQRAELERYIASCCGR